MANRGRPYDKETTHGSNKPRRESLYWRPLNVLYEITLYELLFGEVRLVFGRRDRDYWEKGFDYPDLQSGLRAAEEWDGQGKPMKGWIREMKMGEDRIARDVI